jgi:hypothetical protein
LETNAFFVVRDLLLVLLFFVEIPELPNVKMFVNQSRWRVDCVVLIDVVVDDRLVVLEMMPLLMMMMVMEVVKEKKTMLMIEAPLLKEEIIIV